MSSFQKEDALIHRRILIESIQEAVDELNQAITAADKSFVKQLLAQLTDEWQQLEATHAEVYPSLTDLEEKKLEYKWFIDQRKAAIRARVRAEDCLAGYVQIQQAKSVVPVSALAECVHQVSTEAVNSQAVAGIDSSKVLWLSSDANQDFSSSNTTTIQSKEVVAISGTSMECHQVPVEADSSEINQDLSSLSSLNLPHLVDAEVGRAASAEQSFSVVASAASEDQHVYCATRPSIAMPIQDTMAVQQGASSLFPKKVASSEAIVNPSNRWTVSSSSSRTKEDCSTADLPTQSKSTFIAAEMEAESKTVLIQVHAGLLSPVGPSLPLSVSKLYLSHFPNSFVSTDPLIRVTAYVFRFVNRIRKGRQRYLPSASREVTIAGRETPIQLNNVPDLTVEETASALDYWINSMLRDALTREYDKLLQPQQIHLSNSGEFHPSLDSSSHLIRLAGSIQPIVNGGCQHLPIQLQDSAENWGVGISTIHQQFINGLIDRAAHNRVIQLHYQSAVADLRKKYRSIRGQHFNAPADSSPTTSDSRSFEVTSIIHAGPLSINHCDTANHEKAYQLNFNSSVAHIRATGIISTIPEPQHPALVPDSTSNRIETPSATIIHLLKGKSGNSRMAVLRSHAGATLVRPVRHLHQFNPAGREVILIHPPETTPDESVPASREADLIPILSLTSSISVKGAVPVPATDPSIERHPHPVTSVRAPSVLELLKSNNNNQWSHLPDYHPSGDNHPRLRWKSTEGGDEDS